MDHVPKGEVKYSKSSNVTEKICLSEPAKDVHCWTALSHLYNESIKTAAVPLKNGNSLETNNISSLFREVATVGSDS